MLYKLLYLVWMNVKLIIVTHSQEGYTSIRNYLVSRNDSLLEKARSIWEIIYPYTITGDSDSIPIKNITWLAQVSLLFIHVIALHFK